MIENRNDHNISQCNSAFLCFIIGYQSYNDWKMKNVCCARILLNFSSQAIVKEYVVPNFILKKTLWKIYPLLKCSNINDLKNRVEARETSRGKVWEILGLSSPMNKIGRTTYLSNYNEYLIVASNYIESDNGLPLDSNSLLGQLQRVIKAVKFWWGDNDIINNVTHQVFTPSCQACQWKGEWAWNPNEWNPNKKIAHRFINVSIFRNNSSNHSGPRLSWI